jgi:hypothetical protein
MILFNIMDRFAIGSTTMAAAKNYQAAQWLLWQASNIWSEISRYC